MEETLIKIIKTLQSIKPDPAFVQQSRSKVVTAPQHRGGIVASFGWLAKTLQWGMALGFASLILFIAIGGLAYLQTRYLSPAVISTLNDVKSKIAANDLDFHIQLGEIKYSLEEQNKTIGQKLDELLEKLSL